MIIRKAELIIKNLNSAFIAVLKLFSDHLKHRKQPVYSEWIKN
jgi:hypothetical protein